MSADEDFVETYKLKVLTTARSALNSVDITFPNTTSGSQNIPKQVAGGSKPTLAVKLACIPSTL